MIRVYYAADTGQIIGHDIGELNEPLMCVGIPWLPHDSATFPDRFIQIVDLHAKKIREMTADEMRRFNAPTHRDLMVIRFQELQSTDWRESHPVWATYRQALRDITNAGDVAAMMAEWPLRPDGSSALAQLQRKTEGYSS